MQTLSFNLFILFKIIQVCQVYLSLLQAYPLTNNIIFCIYCIDIIYT